MDVVNYQSIQQAIAAINAKFDRSQYSEHQAINPAVNSSSLITLMSVTGKGYFESALLTWEYNGAMTTPAEIVVTVDGATVFDKYVQAFSGVSGGSNGYETGICLEDSFIGDSGHIHSVDSAPVRIGAGTDDIFTATYPQPTRAQIPYTTGLVIPLAEPIYFKTSLLIQICGVASAGIGAIAKARY